MSVLKSSWIKVAGQPQKIYSDLDLFLGILEDVKEAPARDEIIFNKFYYMMNDYKRACVSGSSVLGKRIGKLEIANDIDIFIDDRDQNSEKIISNFFSKINVREFIWPAYKARVISMDETEAMFVDEARLLQTSSNEYDFGILNYNLTTYRIQLGKHITLNFILLRDNKQEPKAIADIKEGVNPRSTSSINNQGYPFPGRYIRDILSNSLQDEFPDLARYSSYLLEYIDRHFDFQELKYIYDFGSRSYRNIYDIGIDITDVLLDDLTGIESRSKTDTMLNQAIRSKDQLKRYSQEFQEEFGDPEVVTIASKIGQRFSDVQRLYDLDEHQATQGRYLVSTSEDFSNLTKRIKMYQRKGFEVKDPNNVMLDLHINLAAATLGTLLDPDIHRVQRQAIFDSSPSTRKRYLFLNRLKVLINENINDLGMEIVTDEIRAAKQTEITTMMDAL